MTHAQPPAANPSGLITGATRGIGRGIARSLSEQGYGLTVTARNEAALSSLAAELESCGSPRVVHRAIDMADGAALPGLVALHAETFGSMAALVVNAGVGTAGPVASFPRHRLDKTLEVNFVAPFILVQEALPLLREWAQSAPRGAKVVAMSSITGAYPEAGLAAYGASKAALISLVEALNLEESAGGVTATALAPAYVATYMSAWTADTIPAETMIPVEDVVAVVDMLLSLGRTTMLPRIVLARSGTSGHRA